MLRVVVAGGPGTIPADVFLDTVGAALDALNDVDRTLARTSRPRLRWAIAELSTSSAVVALADTPVNGAQPTHGKAVRTGVIKAFSQLTEGRVPEGLSDNTINRLRDVVDRFDPKGARGLSVIDTSSGLQVELTAQNAAAMARATDPPYRSMSSVTGTLEAINVHSRPHVTIYDDVFGRGVRCTLDSSRVDVLLAAAKEALGKHVRGYGMLSYGDDSQPIRLSVTDLETLPADDELPTVAQMFGRYPDFTGGEDIEDYVQRLRDA